MVALSSCLLFLFSFGLFLHGAYPSVSVGDSGELITAAITLGVPHPPGFPTYVLLGKLVHMALPWANPAFHINLFSSLTGAAAVWVLYRLLLKAGCQIPSALFGSLLLVVSLSFRKASQGSEVFALHAFFILLVYWAVAADQWLLAAFLGGLGVGNHQTLVLVAPAVVIGMMVGPESNIRPHWAWLAASGLLGLSIYLSILFRSGQEPFLNVGHGDSLDRLWKIISRANYGSFTLALGETPDRTVANTARQLWRFVNAFSLEVTWFGIAAGLLGAWRWREKNPRMFWAFTLGFITIGPGFFLLANLPYDAQSEGVLGRFLVAPCLLWCAMAAGALEVLNKAPRSLASLAALLPLLIVWARPATADRMDFRAYSYGRNNLRSLPPNAMLIMDGGDDTFYSLSYLTQAEKRRADIELHDRGGVVFKGLYGADFRSLNRADKEVRRQQVEKALIASGRHVLYSTLNPSLIPSITLRPRGFLYASEATTTAMDADALWDLYDLRGIAPWMASTLDIGRSDYRTRAITPFYAFQRGVTLQKSTDAEPPILFVASAKTVGWDVLWLQPNASNLFHHWAYDAAQRGSFVFAAHLYRWILRWDPTDTTALLNLGAVLERAGRYDEAISAYTKLVALAPDSAQGHYNLASALWHKEAWPEVVSHLETVVRLNPAYPSAASFLETARHRAAPRPQ